MLYVIEKPVTLVFYMTKSSLRYARRQRWPEIAIIHLTLNKLFNECISSLNDDWKILVGQESSCNKLDCNLYF